MKNRSFVFLSLIIFPIFAFQAKAQTAISTEGIIESKTGGFKFPDGSIQAVAVPSDLEARVAGLENSSLGFVLVTDEPKILSIPADYPTLDDALSALQKEHIVPGAKVTLQLDAGTYTHGEPLEVRHPDGLSIEILGDPATPANVVLMFSDSSGLILAGAQLSLIDGVTIRGNQTDAPHDKVGIKAGAGATVNLGNNVIVEEFDIGMQAEFGGVLMAEQTSANDNVLHGYLALSGGIIHADGTSASNNGGTGYLATSGGLIQASGASATGNGNNGFESLTNGTIIADGSSAVDNGPFGYYVEGHSVIFMTDATASGNDYDICCVLNTLGLDGSILIDKNAPIIP